MYDKLLDKDEFEKFLKEEGFAQEQINKEWEKIQSGFNALFLKNIFSSLTNKEQGELEQGLMIDKPDDLRIFLNRLIDYILAHQDKLDYKQIAKNSIRQLYSFYSKL